MQKGGTVPQWPSSSNLNSDPLNPAAEEEGPPPFKGGEREKRSSLETRLSYLELIVARAHCRTADRFCEFTSLVMETLLFGWIAVKIAGMKSFLCARWMQAR